MSTLEAAAIRMAKARLTGVARADGFEPAFEVRELAEILTLALGKPHPADAGHVGDRIAAGQKFAAGQPRVHDAVKAVDLVGIARDRIDDRLRRVMPEVDRLSRHRAEPADLPVQPLLDRDAGALLARIEFSGFAAEILQDRAGFEDRDRPPARTGGIDDRRHAVVRRNRQKLRRELLALRNVDRPHDIGQPALFEHDRNFPAVRRRPIIKLDRLLAPRRRLPGGRALDCGGRVFARRFARALHVTATNHDRKENGAADWLHDAGESFGRILPTHRGRRRDG